MHHTPCAYLPIVGHQVREDVIGVYMAQPILHPELDVCINMSRHVDQRVEPRGGDKENMSHVTCHP